ncbi:hypothetical protein P5X00_37015 [Paraburkholderia sp. A2RO-4L]|uniref:hypothetical protein n=1 Tax=Paraburkholderia sp. A2RO-4L TaxID=3028374 RepID=UPI003DA9CE8E
MWPILLILAIVPMVFMWSGSVQQVFPALAKYLPEKTTTVTTPEQQAVASLPPELQKSADSGRWYLSQTKTGYVAWTMSADGQYRLAVGCRAGAEAAIQVTNHTGATMPGGLVLNYEYGRLALKDGYYTGTDLVNAVAQFKDVYLQGPANEVLAQFTMPGSDSNSVARTVESACAQPKTTTPSDTGAVNQ